MTAIEKFFFSLRILAFSLLSKKLEYFMNKMSSMIAKNFKLALHSPHLLEKESLCHMMYIPHQKYEHEFI